MYSDDINVYVEIFNTCIEKKIDSTLLYAFDCVNNSIIAYDVDEKFNTNTIFDMAKLVNRVWLDSDIDLSISRIADVIVDNYDEIQEKNMSTDDILEEYYNTLCNH